MIAAISFSGRFKAIMWIVWGMEVLGLVGALLFYVYDFWVEKPRDRAIANATMYAQIAALDPTDPNDHSAMQAILRAFIDGQVPINDLIFADMAFTSDHFENVEINRSHFNDFIFSRGALVDVRADEPDFSGSVFLDHEMRDALFMGSPIGQLTLRNIYGEVHERLAGRLTRFEQMDKAGFRNVRFDWPIWSNVRFLTADFTDTTFEGPSFSETVFYSSFFDRTIFLPDGPRVASRWDVEFENSWLRDVDFSALTLEEIAAITFDNCIFENTTFPEGYELTKRAGVVLHE